MKKSKARKSIQEKALLALRQAARKAIKEHKMRGLPIVVWKDGKVVKIPASKL